jgi:tetratricopeptide (TPR) repeat protein
VTFSKRSFLAFGILQALVLAAPSLLSAPTVSPTVQACSQHPQPQGASPDVKGCHALALDLAARQDLEGAIAVESRLFEREPANPEIAATLGRFLITGRKDVISSVRLYHEALGASPGYPPALLGLGTVFKDRGEMAIAERYFARGMRENPTLPLFRVRLAEVMVETGRPGEAAPLLQDVIAACPTCGEADDARRILSRTNLARP